MTDEPRCSICNRSEKEIKQEIPCLDSYNPFYTLHPSPDSPLPPTSHKTFYFCEDCFEKTINTIINLVKSEK